MRFIYILIFALIATLAQAATDISGFWTTIDDETNQPKSVVQIYQHNGKMFGRVVKLFQNPDATAKGVKGSPKIVGLDILWNLEDTGKKWTGGEILDPKTGKVYAAEAWKQGDDLVVRGKILMFGRNQTWKPNKDFSNPEKLTPQKPVRE